ncbi:MAG: helix-turn-helix transcriptional regulator [Cyanothece sp. SIO1E1]|nr:helix-turn-helix transcriptional regulator [Cyanothece sp. SIO1E1]
MKPEYEKIVEPPARSFTAKVVNRKNRPLLSQAWHFHPEIEICFTRKSTGRRFVGNQISDYQEMDLVMFGANLPHGFTTDMYCSQVVIQMTHGFMGQVFIDRPELRSIKMLFERAKQGLEFKKGIKRKVSKVINKLLKSGGGISQFLLLLELLQILADTKEVETICSEEFALDLNETQLGRIKIVYDHIMEHFKKEVSIKEVADKLNISEAAFYKFIKKQTKKTYTQIINEFRINHASKLLMTSEKPISLVCFESGYNNISYFNRKFKEVMGQTPHSFKNNYIGRRG